MALDDNNYGFPQTTSQPGVGNLAGGGSLTPDAFNQLITEASSFSVTLNSGQRNAIQWIATKDRILIGTSGGEWRMEGHTSKPLTPANFDLKPQSVWGSKDMQPLVLHEAVLFVDFVGKKLREMIYDGNQERYTSPDVLKLAEHLTRSGGITTMAYQKSPNSIIWATLANGDLISCTYVREQDVIAWAIHPLPQGAEADAATPTSGYSVPPEYPILQELTAAEIPTIPSEPSVSPASSSVSNYTELQAMAGAGTYYLTNDIDLDGETWTPIVDFSGVLDGKGYTIRNLTISAPASSNQGLFKNLKDGVEIYDLNMTDCNVTGEDFVGILFGGGSIAGSALLKNINITNSTVTADGSAGIFGGDFGNLYDGDVYNCSVSGCTVNATKTCGLMFADINMNTNATDHINFVNCSTQGIIVTANASVTGSGGVAGGFCGTAAGASTTEKYPYFHTCDVNVAMTAGTGDRAATLGGFIGFSSRSNFVTCSVSGSITVDNNFESGSEFEISGGFTGFESGAGVYTDCNTSVSMTIDATGTATMQLIGGFVGKCDWPTGLEITRCYATGDITINNMVSTLVWDGIGGFAGGLLSQSSYSDGGIVRRCWATGDITMNHEGQGVTDSKGGLGAFVGEITHIGAIASAATYTIENCYGWGSINIAVMNDNFDLGVSGFAGSVSHTGDHGVEIVITNCYDAQTNIAAGSGFSSQIPTGDFSKGIIGYVESGMTITETALYWDTDTSGITEDDHAEGNITSWMQTESNFTDADWDFDTIWDMPDPVFWKNLTNSNALGANSVTVIPGAKEDEVWVTVGRVIEGVRVGMIERMKPRNFGPDQEDAFFVDSGLTYDSTATTTLTGLDHLEGETVAILGDGAVFPTQTVNDGTVTLAESVSVAQVGLPFTYTLKPMRMDQAETGNTKGSVKQINEVVVSFLQTLNAKYGDGTRVREFKWDKIETYGTPPALFSGDKKAASVGGFSVEDPIEITGSDPVPCTVRAIILRIDKTGR